ncbi:SPW repeat protein [Kitasatospora phosalacinea]|uniref:SPW repeat protein n=1 Tax=Kitasatospora phosalacinea TaxID=2065 RepID=UPI000527F9CF|nr:SPW repeat protein [Kitasatospora phosalacinea]
MEHHPDILALREHAERVTYSTAGQGTEALAICAGLFLAISPWVVGFSGFTGLTISNLVLGIAYAVLMAGYGSAFGRTHARAWACVAIGAWTIIAPWAVNGGAHIRRTILTNAITGGVMTCLALAAVGMVVSGAANRHRR